MPEVTARSNGKVRRATFTVGKSSGMLLGGRVRRPGNSSLASDLAYGVGRFGALEVTRDYLGNSRPDTYSDWAPAATLPVVSFNRGGAIPSANFLRSCRAPYLIFQHEPERPQVYGKDASGGAAFQADLKSFRTGTRTTATQAGLQAPLIAAAASGFNYRKGKPGADGSYITGCVADAYFFDAYRAGTDNKGNAVIPLQDRDEFKTWYAFVQATGKPWGVTEFGAGRVDSPGLVSDIVQQRIDATKSSVEWCRANGAVLFSYFFSGEGPDGENWLPSDSGFDAMYQALPRSH